jgi:hypothetical protein
MWLLGAAYGLQPLGDGAHAVVRVAVPGGNLAPCSVYSMQVALSIRGRPNVGLLTLEVAVTLSSMAGSTVLPRRAAARLAPFLLVSSLVACVDTGDEPVAPDEELATVSSEVAVGTTSVCVTRPGGVTVRADKAVIVAGASASAADAVVVSSGATQRPNTNGTLQFVESGGQLVTGGNAFEIFVAAGGRVQLTGGNVNNVWVKARGTLTCTALGNAGVIHFEPGAILQGCAGKALLVQESVTSTFRRCAATTVVNQTAPTFKIAVTRSGRNVTATNQSTGSYSGTKWTVGAVLMGFPPRSATFFTTTARAGFSFTLPADLDTRFPPGHSSRFVSFRAIDPFGVEQGQAASIDPCPLHPCL